MLNGIIETFRKKNIQIIFFLIVILAFILRIMGISDFTVNYDESVHGYYSYYLLKTGTLDISSYLHGPFLYYISAAAFGLFGDSILTGRLLSVFFGTATILLLYPLRRWLGNSGLITSSFLFAISPFFITFSREFRSDSLLIFFTLAMIIFLVLFIDTKRKLYFFLASANFALGIVVKENMLLILFVLISYSGLFMLLSNRLNKNNILPKIKENTNLLIQSFLIIFLIYSIFYTRLFSKWEGLFTGLESPVQWFRIALFPDPGTAGVYNFVYRYDFFEYLNLINKYEFFPAIMGLIGGVYSFIRKDKFMQFLFFWAASLIVSFSLSSYKQPQLTLNILLPLLMLSGAFIEKLYRSAHENKKSIVILIFLISSFVLFFQSMDSVNKMSSFHESSKQFDEVGKYIENLSEKKNILVFYVNNDPTQTFHPLTWYLRTYAVEKRLIMVYVNYNTNLSYEASFVDEGVRGYDRPIILVADNLKGNLETLLEERNYITFRTGAYVQNLGSRHELIAFYPVKI